MHQQLEEEIFMADHQLTWNPKKILIWCFCHKMGLIVKAGLDALGMKLRRVRHSSLGRFPPVRVTAVIEEEEDDVEVQDKGGDDEEISSEDDDRDSGYSSDLNSSKGGSEYEEDSEQQDEPQNYKKRKTAYLLGNTYMKQLTKDVRQSFFLLFLYCFLFFWSVTNSN
jgi:hypothetical protein